MRSASRILNRSYFLTITIVFVWALEMVGQPIHGGLEGVIVETYYIADENDCKDVGNGDPIAPGSVTYRIFLDLAEGYKLQMIYGMKDHLFEICTTTKFHNAQFAGRAVGADMSASLLRRNTMALDSWLTIGSASNEHLGVPKVNDPDGSVLAGANNDGGDQRVEGGLLANTDPRMGIPLEIADGLVKYDARETPRTMPWNWLNWKVFDNKDNDGKFIWEDSALAVLEGVSGPTEENQVLIAQITTDGELTFKLNFQLLAPYQGVERFFAENPDPNDFTHPDLIRTASTPGQQ